MLLRFMMMISLTMCATTIGGSSDHIPPCYVNDEFKLKTGNVANDWSDFGETHGIAPQIIALTQPKLKQYIQEKKLPIHLVYSNEKLVAASVGTFVVIVRVSVIMLWLMIDACRFPVWFGWIEPAGDGCAGTEWSFTESK